VIEKVNGLRKDAHANDVDPDEMQLFGVHMKNVEKKVDQFLGPT
jgi:hypothetical protein